MRLHHQAINQWPAVGAVAVVPYTRAGAATVCCRTWQCLTRLGPFQAACGLRLRSVGAVVAVPKHAPRNLP